MASNPMQRKTRNAFLLGFLIMLIIAVLIGVVVYMLLIKPIKEEKEQEEAQTYAVYRLKATNSVESGGKITNAMVEVVEIPATEQQRGDLIAAERIDQSGNVQKVSFPGGNSKIALKGGTILTKSMLTDGQEELSDSLRYVEYNMISIPTLVDIGDYVDIRVKLPNTQDLIVISRKQIQNLYGQTVGLNLDEQEILYLNSAIVETYVLDGAAELYLAKYVEAGIQEAAEKTYVPTAEVVALIQQDPNIVETARNAVASAYNNSGNVRGPLNSSLEQYAEERRNNIQSGIQQQIEAARQARENYLSGLEGY